MGKEILDNVAEQYKFWLVNNKCLSNVKELYDELKRMDKATFKHHVNETKNDFYNWIKDIYKNRNLADDLLECSTKEAMLFCLRNHLDKASVAKLFDEIPAGYSRDKYIFDDLPKGYDNQRIRPQNNPVKQPVSKPLARPEIKPTSINKKPVVTLIKSKKVQKKVKKLVVKKRTVIKVPSPKPEISNIKVEDIKKVRPSTQNLIIKQIKEVYGFE